MKKYYIVSFGDSNIYRIASEADAETIRKQLIDCLQKKFPESDVTAFITVDVKEADENTAKDYPELTKDSEEAICDTLIREIRVAADTKELNNNAPFDKINS